MLRGGAFIFALVFIALGILGFIPLLMYNQLLCNVFEVSSVHNISYILTGLIGLSASASALCARVYFKIFGVFYGLLAILGFALNSNLWFLHVNLADSFFHLIVAVIAIYFGFTSKIEAGYQQMI